MKGGCWAVWKSGEVGDGGVLKCRPQPEMRPEEWRERTLWPGASFHPQATPRPVTTEFNLLTLSPGERVEDCFGLHRACERPAGGCGPPPHCALHAALQRVNRGAGWVRASRQKSVCVENQMARPICAGGQVQGRLHSVTGGQYCRPTPEHTEPGQARAGAHALGVLS